jgi:hypothetical protein
MDNNYHPHFDAFTKTSPTPGHQLKELRYSLKITVFFFFN